MYKSTLWQIYLPTSPLQCQSSQLSQVQPSFPRSSFWVMTLQPLDWSAHDAIILSHVHKSGTRVAQDVLYVYTELFMCSKGIKV